MIFTTIISILLFFNSWAQAQIPFPDSLTPDTLLYRGQSIQHTALPEVIKSFFKSGQIVAKSRLYRTLENKFKNSIDINPEMDRYISYLQLNRLFYRIRYCHVDVYDCNFPTLNEFTGEIFSPQDLPAELVEKFSSADAHENADRHDKANLLTIFDPFISVTTDLNIARHFAAQSGANGYVLYLKDVHARNCSRENMARVRCLINHEEYLEELEYPFIGLVYSDELYGIETSTFIMTKQNGDVMTLLDRLKNNLYRLQLDKKNCHQKNRQVRKLKFISEDIKKTLSEQGLKYACPIEDSAD